MAGGQLGPSSSGWLVQVAVARRVPVPSLRFPPQPPGGLRTAPGSAVLPQLSRPSATGFGGGKEFNGVDPSAVQFSSVLFGSVLFGSVQLSSVRFGLVQLSSVWFGSVQFNSVQLSSVQDGIYALGKAHMRSIQALRNLLTKTVATRDNYVRPRPVQMPKTVSL